MELTNEQIKSIAEDLECGMRVAVNIETKEMKSILDFDDGFSGDMEAWEEDINEIEENYEKYVHFEKMDAGESFEVMNDFVDTIDDSKLRRKLDLVLDRPKPFRNFKNIIENDSKYRMKWFAFRDAKYIEFVKEQLDRHNRNISS